VTRDLLRAAARAVVKLEHEYLRQHPDAAPVECWAEAETLASLFDDEVPGWRDW
jgi:hypothetical protein